MGNKNANAANQFVQAEPTADEVLVIQVLQDALVRSLVRVRKSSRIGLAFLAVPAFAEYARYNQQFVSLASSISPDLQARWAVLGGFSVGIMIYLFDGFFFGALRALGLVRELRRLRCSREVLQAHIASSEAYRELLLYASATSVCMVLLLWIVEFSWSYPLFAFTCSAIPGMSYAALRHAISEADPIFQATTEAN